MDNITQSVTETINGATVVENDSRRMPPKLRQLLASRKAWAGVVGMVTTLALWATGEIDAARAVDALTWVVGIFIGAVALEDGMTNLMRALASAPAPGTEVKGAGVKQQEGEVNQR